jgi:beta-glucosidase
MATRDFPVGFLWGAATAAHQVEGGNTNNDWWAWEHMPGSPCVESSGDACDHYHRYAGDLDLLAGLGLNTYRFSLEWSRIEPAEREYSTAALDHYRRMCAECRERRLEPIVTFHHFTTPAWLAARGGWTDPATADRFARFCERAAAHLGDVIGRACTINEPNIVAALGHRDGIFPPGLRDPDQYQRAVETLIAAHRKGAAAIRAAKRRVPVGLTLAMQGHDAVDGGEVRRDEAQREMEDQYLEAVRGDDFLGVQAYTRLRFGPEGLRQPEPGARLTQMGWEFWPEALGACVRHAAARVGGMPLLVTENGIATADDTERVEYLERALASLRDCMRDGIEVQGYLHWSLLDNFEWVHGFRPTFGLIAVDRPTQKRIPKPSATRLGAIAATGTLN